MLLYIPTKVIEEPGAVLNHKEDLSALGTKCMVVTGKHSARENGSLADVQEALESQHIPYVVFDKIEENPSIETVMEARDTAVAEQCDFYLGIGGGSPLDAVKAISLMAYHKGETAEYLYKANVDSTAYPVVCIPTTCGTGSEANGYSILTIHEKRTKSSLPHKVFPKMALIDPKYLLSVPASVLRNTALDALCHLVESELNTKATDYSRMFVEAGFKAWKPNRDILKSGKLESEEDAARMLRASTFGGMAIAHTGTSLPHGLSYGLTYESGTAHGKACARFLAGYLSQVAQKDRLHVLDAAGFLDLDDLQEFLRATCGLEEIPDALAEHIVLDLSQNPKKLSAAPFAVDPSVLYAIVNY